MKTKKQCFIFLMISILLTSCSNNDNPQTNDENTPHCLQTKIAMTLNGEIQTYYVNQSGISLNSDGGYTLKLKMDRQENSNLWGKQTIEIIVPYKKTGPNVIKNFIYHQDSDNLKISGDFVSGVFQSTVITNKNSCFYATFSGKLNDGNQEVIITNGSISYQYSIPFSN